MIGQEPEHIADERIFVIKRSELKGRFDPKIALYNRKVKNSIYHNIKLKDLLTEKPKYGASVPGIQRIHISEPRYIRITDIDKDGVVNFNELGATSRFVEDQYILKRNDILIARSGATVGKAYIHKFNTPYDCFYAGYLIRFVINKHKALPDYVFAYMQLDVYKEWVNAIQRPSGQPNINAEEYQSLEIPLPGMEIQKSVVDMINFAYKTKTQKEQEAIKLLRNIDKYILDNIGITIPEIKNDIDSRIFFTKRTELEGRLDPTVYKDRLN